jgi:hypothetical protein
MRGMGDGVSWSVLRRQECVDRWRRLDGGHSSEELPATQLLIIRAIAVARSMVPPGAQKLSD